MASQAAVGVAAEQVLVIGEELPRPAAISRGGRPRAHLAGRGGIPNASYEIPWAWSSRRT